MKAVNYRSEGKVAEAWGEQRESETETTQNDAAQDSWKPASDEPDWPYRRYVE